MSAWREGALGRHGEDDAFFEMVWNKLAGKVPDDDVAEIGKWIADLIRDAREDGLWEA